MRGLPCFRYNITDAELIDHAVCPRPSWTVRWSRMEIVDIHEWASRDIRTINITQHVTHLRGGWIGYPIKVRQFVPRPGDSLARRWKVDGVEDFYDCAAYGIADMAEAASVMEGVVDDTLLDAINLYIDEKDKLLRSTYMMAYRYSQSAQVCPRLCF